ncbi:hypothetical protein GGQ85_002186 [Nitrobacter vulgaris]|uniref:hypothetical protein n=1 Tax=Nitrobacter vulgaris TaxID=29421 RepID=UPI00285745A6|nr:hypothetical protein [Nitrobacter vulgaris]MDR6304479.1 hypothetical protein [Nitrobacter vulgaris]
MGSATASRSGVNSSGPIALTNVRTGLGADAIAAALIENLHCLLGKLPRYATRNDWYMCLAYTVRDRMMERYVATLESITETNPDANRLMLSRNVGPVQTDLADVHGSFPVASYA